MTIRRTEVEDDAGRVVVETRLLGARTPSGARAWETTIAPGDAPDPDGAEATVFATVESPREAQLAHLQAVDFAAAALKLTARRLEQAGAPPPWEGERGAGGATVSRP